MKERIKLKKLKKILVAFMAVFVFLTGCGGVRGDRFSSEESAKELLLSEMEKRYGMSFIIAGNEKYHDFGGLYGYTYSCNVAPESMPDRTSYAAVFQRAGSGLQDDYVSYFYKDEAEAPVRKIFDALRQIVDYEAELSIDPVDGKWDTGRPVDEFMKENNGHIETTIYFEDGKEANEYTDAIEDIFDNIQSYPYPIVLRIKANDNYIFYWEYYDNKIPSRERILDEVERNI